MDLEPKTLQTDFLRCFLCSEFCEDPKTLPCLHSFCRKCLIKNIEQQTTDKSKKCPVCHKVLDVDPKESKTNLYFHRRVNFIKEQENKLTNPVCGVCKLKSKKNILAIAQCISCLDFLCKICSDKHTLTTLTINHQVFSLTEIKTGKYDDEMFRVRFKMCPKHSDEELKFFCRPCHILTCFDCAVLEHKGHEFKSLDDLKEEKINATKEKYEKLKGKLNTLNQEKDSLGYKKDQLETLKTRVRNNITKKCADTVSKIDKGKNKMLKDIDEFILPKSEVLANEVNRISAQCKTIGEALQYSEFILKGTNADIISSVDELLKTLENLLKDDEDKILNACLSTETPNITLTITEPKMELILGNEKPFQRTNLNFAGPSLVDDNLSDFFSVCDKAIQTRDEDFGMLDENIRTEKRKYKIDFIKCLDLTANGDKYEPYFTGLAWIDENQFVAVDAGNEKLKKCSITSGLLSKYVKISSPLTVSVWAEGIALLSDNKKLKTFTRDLKEQKTFSNVSSLFLSLPSLNQLTWTDNMAIVIHKESTLSKVPIKYFPPTARLCVPWSSCCLPNGSYALLDRANTCVYLINSHGNIFKTFQCNPGSISFDKYNNIFISNFHTCSIGIYDIEVHLTDLYVDGRPKSISILNDKLLVAVEHGCKILVYDITKT